jgi:NAD+ diphosphatase
MADGIVFTGERLDRAAERRTDPAWVAAQAAHPYARAVLAGDDGVHVTAPGEPRLALLPLAPLDAAEPLLLGLDDTGPVFAVDAERRGNGAQRPPGDAAPPPVSAGDQRWTARSAIGAHGEGPPDPGTGTRALGLRAAAATLPQADGGLAAHAAALVNWHRRHRHCAVCGTPTAVAEGGIVRRCPRCGTDHHPRTDPVVIMLVTDGDRVLLGRQPVWPPRRYSALAGFVEPGESLEEAVAREVREEAGVEVGPPRYVASQPWPFPTSLMLGFTAPWRSGEPRRIDEELEDVRWFDRADVAAAIEGRDDGPLAVPPRFAIARRLLERWLQR